MSHDDYQTCIEACHACADACDRCVGASLVEPLKQDMLRCIGLVLDCTAVCRAAAGFMNRDSELVRAICRLCAEISDACGMECASHREANCQACAQACYRCAAECRRVAEGAHVPMYQAEAVPRANRPNA